jgi:hypothetical protein
VFAIHRVDRLTRVQLKKRKDIAYRHGCSLVVSSIYGGVQYGYEQRAGRRLTVDERMRVLADVGALRRDEARSNP